MRGSLNNRERTDFWCYKVISLLESYAFKVIMVGEKRIYNNYFISKDDIHIIITDFVESVSDGSMF